MSEPLELDSPEIEETQRTFQEMMQSPETIEAFRRTIKNLFKSDIWEGQYGERVALTDPCLERVRVLGTHDGRAFGTIEPNSQELLEVALNNLRGYIERNRPAMYGGTGVIYISTDVIESMVRVLEEFPKQKKESSNANPAT